MAKWCCFHAAGKRDLSFPQLFWRFSGNKEAAAPVDFWSNCATASFIMGHDQKMDWTQSSRLWAVCWADRGNDRWWAVAFGSCSYIQVLSLRSICHIGPIFLCFRRQNKEGKRRNAIRRVFFSVSDGFFPWSARRAEELQRESVYLYKVMFTCSGLLYGNCGFAVWKKEKINEYGIFLLFCVCPASEIEKNLCDMANPELNVFFLLQRKRSVQFIFKNGKIIQK